MIYIHSLGRASQYYSQRTALVVDMVSSTFLVCTFTSPVGSAVTPQVLTIPLMHHD